MTIYGFAEESHECYGHGDYGTEDVIRRAGPYGSGDFRPFFTDRKTAEAYAASVPYPKLKIVEFTLDPDL